jgi:MarR family transcriptional regulator, lower aerobic nicotinate degradation pathway regulator
VSAKSNTEASVQLWTLADAYRGPGHLIRRLQQIAVAIFMDEFRNYEITPVQYIALVAVRNRPGLEQQAIADLIAIDRSSAGRVFQFLEVQGYVQRITPKNNRRTKQIFVTTAGARLLATCSKLIRRAEERILKVLNAQEQRQFMQLLVKLVDVNNTLSRAPLRIADGEIKNGAALVGNDAAVMQRRPRLKGRSL